MKTCEKCNLRVRGKNSRCPLCQGVLKGTDDVSPFPEIKTVYKQFELFFKLLILGTVVGGVAAVTVNLILPQGGGWSFFVVLGILCFWLSFALAVKKRNNIPKNITYHVVVICLLSVLWDWVTGWHRWSLNYVIPIACTVAMVSLGVVAKVLKMKAGDYLICFILDVLFGIVPLAFYLTDRLTVTIPTAICLGVSVIALVSVVLFEGKAMRLELTKRLRL